MKKNLKKLFSIIMLPSLLYLCLGTFAQALTVPPERQVVVADDNAGTDNKGSIFLVDLASGNRTLISDFGNPAQGPLGEEPTGIALEDFNNVLVTDEGAGTNSDGVLFRVDLRTGDRVMISDFGNPAQGLIGSNPVGVVLVNPINALVVDVNAGTGGDGALFRVDLRTGNRTVISDFGDPAQGPLGDDPQRLAFDSSGNVLITDLDAGMDINGVLFRVRLNNGNRTIVSDFSDPSQGPLGLEPDGVALEDQASALVSDRIGVTPTFGALYRVDLNSGQRTVVSDFGNPAQGPLGDRPRDVILDSSSAALVIDEDAGTDQLGALFSVDLSSGDRTMLSDFGNPAQGPTGVDPEGVVLRVERMTVRPIPTFSEWGLIATAGILGLAGLYAVRRKKLSA